MVPFWGMTEDARFDSKENWRPRKLRESHRFIPGKRIEDTLLTVIGPGRKDYLGNLSWQKVECLCDPQYGGCGNIITPHYVEVYRYPYKYSCGCKRRHNRQVDSTGETVTGYFTGRVITVLLYDEAEGKWQYVCECCGDTGYVPRGGRESILMRLKAIARIPCPNLPHYYRFEELPDIVRHTKLVLKKAIDEDLEQQAKEKYPGCKLIYRNYENRVSGIETRLKPNPAPPVEPIVPRPTVDSTPIADFDLDEDLDEI